MATFAEIVAGVRAMLDDPSPQSPNPRAILEHYKLNAQLLFTQAQNSAVSWSVNSTILTTAADTDTYLITAQNFGKDVLVHTIDPANEWHVERVIPRISMQSRQQGYFGPKAATTSGTYHTAELMVFYREDGSTYVQIRPQPAGSVSYKIWYDVETIGDVTLSGSPILPSSHPYLQLRVAASCLPYCVWTGGAEDETKRRNLGVMFAAQMQEQRDAFLKYLATDRQIGVTVRRGFDDEVYAEGLYFDGF